MGRLKVVRVFFAAWVLFWFATILSCSGERNEPSPHDVGAVANAMGSESADAPMAKARLRASTTPVELLGKTTASIPTWIQEFPAVSPPPLRSAAMTFDSARAKIVLGGGRGTGTTCVIDTWQWDGTACQHCAS